MQVTIDKFGRILIPKRIRNLLGLFPGQALELFTDEGASGVGIKVIPKEYDIRITTFGLPIIQDGPPSESTFDTVAFMQETRDEYLNKKIGLN